MFVLALTSLLSEESSQDKHESVGVIVDNCRCKISFEILDISI